MAAGTLTTIIGAVGLGLSGLSTVQQVSAQREASEAQNRAENIRKAQVDMEAQRQRRSAIRQAQVAQATATQTATNQGAAQGSGLQGGLAQISGQMGDRISNVNISQGLSDNMFEANAQRDQALGRANTWNAVGNMGNRITDNRETIGRVSGFLFR